MIKFILAISLVVAILSCKTKKTPPSTDDPLYKTYENYLDSFTTNEAIAIQDSLQLDGPDSANNKKKYDYYDAKAKSFTDSMDKYIQLWLKH